MSSQPRRNRVGLVREPDRAPLVDLQLVGRVGRESPDRQGLEVSAFFVDLALRSSVEPIHSLLDERLVVGDRAEVSTTTDHQRLSQCALEAAVGLLRDAVFVGVVAADHFRCSAQTPQRALDAIHQRLIGLTGCQTHPSPTTEREHELEQKVREDCASDRHAELGGVGEVDLRFSARGVNLLEENFAVRSVKRPPVPDPALQGAQLSHSKLARMALLQEFQDRRTFKNSIAIPQKQRLDIRLPDTLEGILASSPTSLLLRLRRKRPLLPCSRCPNAHAGNGCGCLLALPIHTFPPQQPHLLVRHHPRHPLPGG